jgi:hypothetical protein
MIHRVMVTGAGPSERLQITSEWVGGGVTAGSLTRPMSRIAPVRSAPVRCERLKPLAPAGSSPVQSTVCLAQAGVHAPQQAQPCSRQAVLELRRRWAVPQRHRRRRPA